ncbi:hypothetical protein [Flavihumibacter petaseus]|uniref:DUF1440 domain-containing protein n=1 Tax=Flavihumibacter petaseus NBRC 106054 TaxID=1220578 RepID=A0A0E9N720_9BACT|nr:hypothetical protein [Flavihumibacter petaseus]GAO45624.1 hypothetical protein FPE01S_07_00120 [Flavihumibacter petaseus NBRC 106054]
MKNKTGKILKAGIIVGCLDLAAAFVMAWFRSGASPLAVLRYIAAGLLGPAAFKGGAGTALLGLLIHFCIALAFTWIFFQLLKYLRKWVPSPILLGILFGVLVWTVMNLLVLPVSQLPSRPFRWKGALEGMAILILAIGIPLSFLSRKNYNTD